MMGFKNRVFVFCAILFAFAAAAHAGHGFHSWTKVKQEKGHNGQILCKWYCDGVFGKESHYKETSGSGRCPNP